MQSLKIVQHNVANWQSNKIPLSNIYNELNPDIVLINEHSCTNQQRIKIFNYTIFQSNKNNEHYSGTAIAIRQGLTTKLFDNFHTDLLAVEIETATGPIVIATTYIPPRTNYINNIDFHTLFHRPEPVYLIADLNAKHRTIGNQSTNFKGRQIDTMISQNKVVYIGPHFPTVITHNGSTSPDIALTNRNAYHNIHLHPGPLTPSDHIPIIATISAKPIYIPIKPRKSFHRANWEQYKQQLETVPIPTEPNPTLEEIDQSLEQWTLEILNADKDTIPTIEARAIPGIKPTHEMNILRILYQEIIHDIRTNGPSLPKYRRLNEIRQELYQEYKQKSNENWDQIIQKLDIERDPSKFWKSINRMQGNNKQQIPYLKDTQQNRYYSAEEKEPLFRNHWQHLFSNNDNDNNNFDYDHIQEIEDQMQQNIQATVPHDTGNLQRINQTEFPPISLEELDKTLQSFKQKAPGPTGITTAHIKHLPNNMKLFLLYIFNNAISAGYFPDSLKQAIMIFIPKSNTSQHDIRNYRPISLLDVQGKLLDKILNARLYNHIQQNNILNIRQHGFRKNRGTHTALAVLQEKLSTDLRNKHTIDIVLRDVSKAFDKVWHTGLKFKIMQLNIHNSFKRTLCDYLTDRTAKIRIANHIGPSFPLESGVPQGACLSPTLYSFYTHDMPPPLPDTDYICFADDITQIISVPYNYKVAAQNTSCAIEQINKYENKWKIQTNQSKFKIIAISRQNTDDIFIDDNHLQYTNSGKILGLHINTNGIKNQISNRLAIGNSHLNKLQRFRNLNPSNKLKLYTATARSALTYPPIPLHTVSNHQMKQLQKVQNRALRFITNSKWYHFRTSKSLHDETHLLPINIFLHNLAAKSWKNMQRNDPDLYNSFQTLPDHIYLRRKTFPSSKKLAERPRPRPIY